MLIVPYSLDNPLDYAHRGRMDSLVCPSPRAEQHADQPPDCGFGDFCADPGSPAGGEQPLVCGHKHVARGEVLYRQGDPLSSIYPVKAGSFKLTAGTDGGELQVMGFCMRGDVMGLDALATRAHGSTATAMEYSEVCIVRFESLENLCTTSRPLQQHFHRVLARQIAADQSMMLVLGSMGAEERVASFLLSVSARLLARGYSAIDFNLRMTREEMGSYLGMKLETVSRALSSLQARRLIAVEGKHLRVLDVPGLEHVGRRTDRKA
jgi:CRP/FNR family transcriptional regulator, anaerobic regulatory protein